MACCKRKGDPRKCILFYVVGGVLIFVGLPLMIVGIVAQFTGADLVGYIGGICIFFGLGFFLLWHMFTIENVDKAAAALDYDPDIKDIKDVVAKSYQRQSSSLIWDKNTNDFGVPNNAFEDEKNQNFDLEKSDCNENGKGLKSLDVLILNESIEMKQNVDADEQFEISTKTSTATINVNVPSRTPSVHSSTSYEKTTSSAIINENVNTGSMLSIPVEIA